MAVKKCCVENCNSSSTRAEDVGVTYHKFPKDKALREKWVSVTQFTHTNTDHFSYVCSRHFCKSDFQIYQDSKYVLKSGIYIEELRFSNIVYLIRIVVFPFLFVCVLLILLFLHNDEHSSLLIYCIINFIHVILLFFFYRICGFKLFFFLIC